MSIETKFLESRLLTRDSVIGAGTSLTKCAQKLVTFGNNITDRAALENFLRELLLLRLEATATKTAFGVCEKQLIEYAALETDIERRIEEKKQRIKQLELELKQQRFVREHRVECETTAIKVNALPSRTELKRKVDALNEQIADTTATLESVEHEIIQRKSQLDMLVDIINQLKNPLPLPEGQQAVMEVDDGEDDDLDLDGPSDRNADHEDIVEVDPKEGDEDGGKAEGDEDDAEEEEDEDDDNEDEDDDDTEIKT